MGKQNKRLDNATITERRPGYYEIKVYYNDISGKLKRKSFSGRDIKGIPVKPAMPGLWRA